MQSERDAREEVFEVEAMSNLENNVLRILSASSLRHRWLSAASCAYYSGVSLNLVSKYIAEDWFGQIAYRYRYAYRVREVARTRATHSAHYNSHLFLSAVRRDY